MVHAFIANSLDVSLGDECVAESPPELVRALGTDEVLDERFDLTWRLRPWVSEFPHVAFRQQPVAQPDTAQGEGCAAAIEDLPAIYMDESFQVFAPYLRPDIVNPCTM